MAVFEAYGNQVVSGSGNWMRLYARVDTSYPSAATCNVRVQIQVGTRYPVSDSNNSFSAWGGAGMPSESGSRTVSHGGNGQWTTIYDRSFSVSRNYGSNKSLALAATLTGIEATPGTSRVDLGYVVEGRPYSAPAAPTSLTATRQSDTHTALAWAATSTTAAPISSYTVQRQEHGGAWLTLGTTRSASERSWTNTDGQANRRYDFRVRSNGPGGSSAWHRQNTGASDVSTTPAAPSSVTAAKDAAGNIVVTWSGTWPYPTGWLHFDVEESTDGGTSWTSRATSLGTATRSWTHASPDPASPHQYRVRARSLGPALNGAWKTSPTVQLLAPPNKPQITGPNTAVDATSQISLTWAHSPVDSTPQRLYEVRYRVDGGEWETTGEAASAITSHVVPANTWENGQAVEWQVRTWGLHADASPWSSTATLTLSAAPTVAIATPTDGGVWDSSRVTVEWAYYQQQGSAQSQWRVTLTQGGAQIEQRAGSGTAASVALSTTLLDGGTYTIAVEVRSAAGVWSAPDTATITVEYAKPPAATVTATFDDSLGVMVLTLATPEGTPAAVSALVERRIDGGAWETIATDLDPSATLVDATTTTSGLAEYRAVTVSALPSSMVGPVTAVQAHGCYLYLSTRDGRVARLASMVRVSVADEREHALVAMAGRSGMVRLDSEHTRTTYEITARLWQAEEVEALRAIWSAPGVCLLRDTTGRREWVSLSRGSGGEMRAAMTLPWEASLTATVVGAP